MLGLSQTLAAEWGQHNIQVNAISPGPVRGERMDEVVRRRAESSGRWLDSVTAEYSARLALGHFVEPDNIVALAQPQMHYSSGGIYTQWRIRLIPKS